MMNRYRFAFAILAICATITLLSVPVITTTEARSILPAKVILYKSTTESPRISAVAAGAFLDGLSAGAMAIIAANALLQVDVYYGSTLLRGYTGAAAVGTGETLGAANFEDDCADDSTALWDGTVDSLAFDTDHYVLSRNGTQGRTRNKTPFTALTSGGLYKVSSDLANGTATGDVGWRLLTGGGTEVITKSISLAAGYAGCTRYITSVGTEVTFQTYVYSNINGTIFYKNVYVKRVLTPSTSGCLLYNSRALTTQSVIVDTLTKNQSAYTVILSKPR